MGLAGARRRRGAREPALSPGSDLRAPRTRAPSPEPAVGGGEQLGGWGGARGLRGEQEYTVTPP